MSGVLSDVEIRERSSHNELIVAPIDEAGLRPAAYDVKVAKDGLIAPDGREVPPDGEGWRRRRRIRKVVLQPGDAALFSTAERFRLPLGVAGNITIRNRLAIEGLMLLSGMLIDPGYGLVSEEQKPGCRIYLHVANVGRQTIDIRPGSDRIATVQFLPVQGGHDHRTRVVPGSLWVDQALPSLGFLTEMKELRERVDKSDTRSGLVVLFGFVVLAVALIGTALSTALAFAQKEGALELLHRLENRAGGALLVLGFVAAAVVGLLVGYTLCSALFKRSTRRRI